VDGGRTGTVADHRLKVGTVLILRSICVINPCLGQLLNWFEADILGQACGRDPAGFLLYGSLVPPGWRPVVSAHAQCAVYDN
jgi:hypothetical protein